MPERRSRSVSNGDIGEPVERQARREYPFPEDPVERMGLLLASFNASPKATIELTLSKAMAPTSDVNKTFRELYAGTDFGDSLKNREMGAAYLGVTLCPIGLVAEELRINYFGRSKAVGYLLTEAGTKYGQPVAARFLEFETEEGFSLYPVFGKTGKSSRAEVRTPLVRAKILMSLLGGKKREIDLAKVVEMHQTQLHPTLNLMRSAGVFTFESVNARTNRKQLTYSLNREFDGAIEAVQHNMPLTTTIARTCLELEQAGIPITQQHIYDHLPASTRDRWQKKYLQPKINNTLSELSQQGYLHRESFDRGGFSDIELTEKGITVARGLLLPLLDAVHDGETLAQWSTEVLPRVRGNLGTYVRATADLYYPYSKSASLQKHGEYLVKIEALLGEKVESDNRETDIKGMTISEIAARLGIHRRTVANYVSELMNAGRINDIEERGTRYISLRTQKDS